MLRRNNKDDEIDTLDFEALEVAQLTAIKQRIVSIIKQKQDKAKQDIEHRLHLKASNLGINLSEFFERPFASSNKQRTTQVKPKYEYKGVKWSGRGRHPNIYQQYFENGGKKEDLLIENKP
jgi:DNA-binding protein H-NS